MRKIGGFFPPEPCCEETNQFWNSLVPAQGDLRFMMSGRCANYYVLNDICLTDQKKVAYVPEYTCETVLAPFEKAGYQLLFYPISRERLTPIFDPSLLDRISVISICGYYGFSSYDQEFIRTCHDHGITILEDTTHSIFSEDGISPCCDYVVGSLRKWIGVPAGGFAIKCHGKFTLPVLPANTTHLSMRANAMKVKKELEYAEDEHSKNRLAEATEQFWDAEWMLRKIFDAYECDADSAYIMKHFSPRSVQEQRRANYEFLIRHLPDHPSIAVIFPELPEGIVPSHFTVYVKNRDAVQTYLKDRGISTTAYWPRSRYVEKTCSPESAYIYDHVLSLPCDQRYREGDMQYICDCIAGMPDDDLLA